MSAVGVGRQIAGPGTRSRYHKHFAPRGTIANFVQLLGENFIRVSSYERGVEGETLACGTGVTDSALIAACVHQFRSPVKVQVQGGDTLEVSFDEKNGAFENVRLTGPCPDDMLAQETCTGLLSDQKWRWVRRQESGNNHARLLMLFFQTC